jgi:streptogramin lyase/mono/diheme cytochrome c family protein
MAFIKSNSGRRIVALAAACVGLALASSGLGQPVRPAAAQTASPTPGAPAFPPATYDESLRDLKYYRYKRVAESGAERGRELYYFKCWQCHNEFQTTAPQLKGLYQLGTLISGEPVNDATLSERIKNGGPGMPSFRYELSDADVADLVSFVRDKCCWDPEAPPSNPQYHATPAVTLEPDKGNVRGGPWGFVRSVAAPSRSVRTTEQGAAEGTPLEGIMVQLRGARSNITTTVYSDDKGRFEFPKVRAGTYTLRIARALEFKPYFKPAVMIDGAASRLDDIVLEPVSRGEFVPANWDIAAQLAGAELVWNVDGTAQEKRTFSYACGSGCHTYGQILRNRFDERSWRLIVTKMTHNTGSLLLQVATPNRVPPEEQDVIVKWLTKVRGPDSKDMSYQLFPAPRGPATKAVITEYELPHLLTAPHDPVGDSRGNIWYNSHRTSWLSKLDPRTGIVEEYKVPSTRGANPGQHWLTVDERDMVWFSENWSHKLGRFDPKTEKFEHVQLPHFRRPLNAPAAGNLALAPDHSIWEARDGAVHMIDPKSGQVAKEYKLQKARGAYGNELSLDGRYFAGGGWPEDWVIFADTKTGDVFEQQTRTPRSGPKRGGFDPDGNAWFGGTGGLLVKFDAKTYQLSEYRPPTPGVTFYECMPDKNGEIWAGELYAGRIVRFNPKTDRWTEYVLPSPVSHDRRTWIDNTTTPVSVWYVDHDSIMVRIQPLE